MDQDPREEIKERLHAIVARRKLLAHYVQEDWQLANEQRALRQKHDRLERELTKVRVRRVAPGISGKEPAKPKTAESVVKNLSKSERQALIDALKAGLEES